MRARCRISDTRVLRAPEPAGRDDAGPRAAATRRPASGRTPAPFTLLVVLIATPSISASRGSTAPNHREKEKSRVADALTPTGTAADRAIAGLTLASTLKASGRDSRHI
jgi:hypothetical protein